MNLIAKICRRYYPNQTKGDLTVINEDAGEVVFECKTLELPWLNNARNISCIPEGVYKVVPRSSKKYDNHLHVTGVEGRSLILIHPANYVGSINPKTGHSDLRGCIAVGYKFGDITGDNVDEILQSKQTMKDLMELASNGFLLEITQ